MELRTLRLAMRMSVMEAARMMGVPVTSWQQWEHDGVDAVVPSPTQRRLDDFLFVKAEAEVRERFLTAVAGLRHSLLASAPLHLSPGSVFTWTGHEVRLLRQARRMSVREFAAHLGVSDRMVSKWEAGGRDIRPRPVNEQALDTSLRQADSGSRERFYAALTSHPPLGAQTAALTSGDPPSMNQASDKPPCYKSSPAYSQSLASLSGKLSPSCEDKPPGRGNGSPASGHGSSCWQVVVPLRVSGDEAAHATAERIATAVGWLVGVQVDGVQVRRRDTTQG